MRAPDRFRLDKRTAFVSGAGGHLGRVMARALAEAGAHVILNGRSAGPLEDLRDDLYTDDLSVEIAAFDIRDTDALKACLKSRARLDVLVNNAYTGRPGKMESARKEDFDDAFASAVGATFQAVQASLPALEAAARETGSASVINIASMYGHVSPDPKLYGDTGLNSPPWYGAAKGALLQLTRYLACHLAEKRIRVNAISPGPFPRAAIAKERPAFVAALAEKTPLKRIGRPEEIAGPLLFLASDASSYITGINLPVDGGWTAW
jgi:NAD(P)-dependent dehydrogenase (short-subunit alcohol dehydrogenase family)